MNKSLIMTPKKLRKFELPDDEAESEPGPDEKNRKQGPAEQESDVKKDKEEINLVRESVSTVSELLESWKKEYVESYETAVSVEDKLKRQELGYRITNMEIALGLSRLKASDVKIAEAETGVLGFYTATGEVFITPPGIRMDSKHYEEILVHESVHKGTMTGGKEILDEGITQNKTKKIVSTAIKDVYEKEQAQTTEAFGKTGIDEAVEKYDIGDPGVLASYFLEVEIKDRWYLDLKTEFEKEMEKGTGEKEDIFEKIAKRETDALSKLFEDGVPELFEELKNKKFNFKDKIAEILKTLDEQSAE